MASSRHLAIVFTGVLATLAGAGDWPFWRGPEQTGMTREPAPVTSWSLDGENLVWSIDAGGRTTPVIMNGRLFAIMPVGEGVARRERVLCLDANTGKKIWEHAFNVFLTDIVENRVGWTALVGDPETGNVYAHGTGGEFFCFNRDGKILWKRSMTEELGRISGYGGRLVTPIVDENRVIVSFLSSSWGKHARPVQRYVAFDKRTGAILWFAAPGGKPLDTIYSTPAVAVVGGKRLLITADADGNVYGLLARNGAHVWRYRLSKRGLNCSIVVDGDYAYVCHSEENLSSTKMGSIVCIDATKDGDITDSGAVWRLDGYTVGYASPAVANGRLYVVNNSAILYAIDAKTGKVYWQYSLGRVGKGSPTVTADGVIYVGEQNGVFHILRDAGDKCIPLDRDVFSHKDDLLDEFFGSPAIANGRVYFMTRYGTYCIGKPEPTRDAPKPKPMPAETAQHETGKYGMLQVSPAEITLRPGQSIQLTATHYDTVGKKTVPPKPKWLVKGVKGTVTKDGKFTAAKDQVQSAGEVTADWFHNMKSSARIRIMPELPLSEDFESHKVGSVPPGWVGAASKSKIVELDGGKVLKKLATKERPSPPFMRIRGYATTPIKGGFTVQADVKGTLARERFKPDMGLLNSRYRFIMMGRGKKLRIETWHPLPRLRKDERFEWETDKWYRIKFQVKPLGDKALVRAKVWPRDDSEPTAWSIEVEDPYPNREGSAGIYGYSPGTTSKSDGPEIFYDNFKVMRNE